MSDAKTAQMMSGVQKAALIFLLLEEKGAAKLFDHMTDDEIKLIGNTLLELGEVSVEDLNSVLNEFYEDIGVPVSSVSGKRVFERLVSRSLPAERKGKIFDVAEVKGGQESEHNPLEEIFIQLAPKQIYKMISDEHPQTVAVILTLLQPKKTKKVIGLFNDEEQVDLLYRMSILEKIPEHMIHLLAENYKKMLRGGKDGLAKDIEVPGSDVVLRYLKTQAWSKAEEIINQIESESPDIAEYLRKNYFTMDDLLRADANGIRNLLKNVEAATLSVVLKANNDRVRELFFKNMSSRAATIMKEDMEAMPEPKPDDVIAAENVILDEAKKLMSDGHLVITGSGDDE